jgi:hypothetical protein
MQDNKDAMKNIITLIMVMFVVCVQFSFAELPKSETQSSPTALVSDLYKQEKDSVFFQTKSREQVAKYFTEPLSDLIWKDAVSTPEGDMGALDFDPLYDAQDVDVKNFAVHEIKSEKDKSVVVASFENMGGKTQITFSLVSTKAGWRIDNIKYPDGRTLSTILSGNAKARVN